MHAAEQIKKFGLIGCLLLSACWFVYQSYNATVRFAFGDFQVAVVAAERINIGIDPYDLSALASRPIDPLYKYPPFLGSILRLVLPLGWHGICVLGLVLSFLFYITTFFLILKEPLHKFLIPLSIRFL